MNKFRIFHIRHNIKSKKQAQVDSLILQINWSYKFETSHFDILSSKNRLIWLGGMTWFQMSFA